MGKFGIEYFCDDCKEVEVNSLGDKCTSCNENNYIEKDICSDCGDTKPLNEMIIEEKESDEDGPYTLTTCRLCYEHNHSGYYDLAPSED